MQNKNISDDNEMSEAELDEISGGNNINSISDMPQQQQMKMQMYLDRKSKAYETLSNVMKKMSATGDTITKNQK